MPRFHIGLLALCPLDSVSIAGYSFQKESWVFNESGAHSVLPGLKFEIPTEEEAKAFETLYQAQAKRFAIRVARSPKDGSITRADLVDPTTPGFRGNPKTDIPVGRFTYCKRVAVEETAPDPLLTEPTEAEASLAQDLDPLAADAPALKGAPVAAGARGRKGRGRATDADEHDDE